MQTSNSIKEIAAALAKAQSAMDGAKKSSTNPHFKSRYADLESVVDAIKPALTANGIAYVQFPVTNDRQEVGVETMLCHASGEWIRSEPFFVPVTKADAQGFGSALTYCRRYSLAAACGVAPEDDDGNAAAKAAPAAIPADPREVELSLASCQEAAMQGRAALVKVWKKLPDAVRAALSPKMAELGKVADAADQHETKEAA